MSLEFRATWWLKHEKRCALVLHERTPRAYHCGRPDVLGILPSRHLLEIEIKRSVSDFKANSSKHFIQMRENENAEVRRKFIESAPKQFWFMVPKKLVDQVIDLVPDYAGLMTAEDDRRYDVTLIKRAPVNQNARRLSIGECARVMHNVGNQMMKLHEGTFLRAQMKGNEDWDRAYGMEYDYENQTFVPRADYLNFQI
jgi:hypothetical protein